MAQHRYRYLTVRSTSYGPKTELVVHKPKGVELDEDGGGWWLTEVGDVYPFGCMVHVPQGRKRQRRFVGVYDLTRITHVQQMLADHFAALALCISKFRLDKDEADI